MNLIINTDCNKMCSFCFTKTSDKRVKEEMTVEKVKQLIQEAADQGLTSINIMGGEPTQHTNFPEIIDVIKESPIEACLITNMLCSIEKAKLIKSAVPNIGVLINGMELNDVTMNVVKRNVEIISKSPNFNRGVITLSITILDSNDREKAYKYLEEIERSTLLEYCSHIRVGLDLTKPDVLGNTGLGDKLEDVIRLADKTNTEILLDCQVPRCTMNEYVDNRIYGSVSDIRPFSGCEQGGEDIKPNGTLVYCYPLEDPLTVDVAGVDNWVDKAKDMYKGLNYELPQQCKDCKWLNVTCDGLCKGAIKYMK